MAEEVEDHSFKKDIKIKFTMETIEKKQNQFTFSAETNESLANAIRRYMNQILVLAIDEVEIVKNGSALYDEVVAHRLGLVPLKMSEGIKDKGKLKLVFNKEGLVYSGELKGNVEIVYDNIPITFLDKNQEIELVATTKEGKGNEHVKFSPGIMFYRKSSELTMDKSLMEQIKNIFPKMEIKEKGDKIIVFDNKKKEARDVIEGLAEKQEKKIEVNEKPELIITIESFGQLEPKKIFEKSIVGLKKDLEEISKKLK